MKSFKILFVIIIFFVLAYCFKNQYWLNPTAKIISYGIIKSNIQTESVIKDKVTTSGYKRKANEAKITKETDLITAELGIRFGINYIIKGLPYNKEIIFTKIIIHPEIKKSDTNISTGYSIKEKIITNNGQIKGITGYGFDHKYELVPGEWTIMWKLKNKILFKKIFKISLAKSNPN